jgi:hypothetical protein
VGFPGVHEKGAGIGIVYEGQQAGNDADKSTSQRTKWYLLRNIVE